MENALRSRGEDKNEQITAETHQIMNTRPLLDKYYMKLFFIVFELLKTVTLLCSE